MAQPSGTSAVIFDLKPLARFDPLAPVVTVLAETGDMQLILICLKAGQSLTNILTPSQIMAQCLRGRSHLVLADSSQGLRAGLVALIEAHTVHTITASTDCVLLLTLTPSSESTPAHTAFSSATTLVRRS